jgi:hypothetical protein
MTACRVNAPAGSAGSGGRNERWISAAVCKSRCTIRIGPAQVLDLAQGLGNRHLEVLEVDGLGQEVQGAEVHRGADVAHVAVGGDDHRAQPRPQRAQVREESQPIHHRHVDVAEDQVEPPVVEVFQGLLPVAGEGELVEALADLAAEALPDQQFQVRLVVHDEDLGCHGASARASSRSLAVIVAGAGRPCRLRLRVLVPG